VAVLGGKSAADDESSYWVSIQKQLARDKQTRSVPRTEEREISLRWP
jgi:hypothetical protein